MKKNYMFNILLSLMIVSLLSGCAARNSLEIPELFTPKVLKSELYVPGVDNFIVIIDASNSMRETYNDMSRFSMARGVVDHMNRTLPDLDIKGALRSFGHCGIVGKNKTELFYGVVDYSRAGLRAGLDKIVRAGGDLSMTLAIDAAALDLDGLNGKTAVIVVSDGKSADDSAVEAARLMKNKFGDALCIYSIMVGNDLSGASTMEEIAKAGGCGRAVNADDLISADKMADFVEDVFLVYPDVDADGVLDHKDRCPATPPDMEVDAWGCPLDEDVDGVYDYLDQCPATPLNMEVDDIGCPLDSDNDSVRDYLDECPGTPANARVDENGCWVIGGDILFNFDKAEIKRTSLIYLDEIVLILKNNPSLNLKISGYTDALGPASYNLKLSKNRSKAVKRYITGKGVKEERLDIVGYGEANPVASNKSKGGRSLNRRTEIEPIR